VRRKRKRDRCRGIFAFACRIATANGPPTPCIRASQDANWKSGRTAQFTPRLQPRRERSKTCHATSSWEITPNDAGGFPAFEGACHAERCLSCALTQLGQAQSRPPEGRLHAVLRRSRSDQDQILSSPSRLLGSARDRTRPARRSGEKTPVQSAT
jgi:hypothetical protein